MTALGELVTAPEEWDSRLFGVAAFQVATWSKDPAHGVGALVVTSDRRQVSFGYNGFPRGIADLKQRLMDPDLKNRLTVHAERNALDNAGFDTAGCTLYSSRFPCHECAKAVISKRVARVVAPPPELDHPTWGASQRLALELLQEAGVRVATVRVEEGAGR